jgi:hypothetical protein
MPPRPAPIPVSNVTAAITANGLRSRRTGSEVIDLTDMARRQKRNKWDDDHGIPRRNMNQIDFSARLMRKLHISKMATFRSAPRDWRDAIAQN